MDIGYGRSMIWHNKEFSWPSPLVLGSKSQGQCLLFIAYLSDHTMIYANELTLERSLDNSTMRASHTRKTNPVTTVVGLRATGCQSDLLGGNGRLTLNLIHWSMIQSIRPRKQNLNENPVHHRRWGSSLGGDTQQYHQGDIS